MNKITVIGYDELKEGKADMLTEQKQVVITGGEKMGVNDGYHTFDELYKHRIELYIALCCLAENYTGNFVWKSENHHDGSNMEGWFIMGIGTQDGEQISYHLPIEKWDDCEFANTFEKSPVKFDGHTSDDVLERLKYLIQH